ncbi:MAG: ArsR/SmtB family transcription factor [Planctomycetota bacterium]
MATDLPPACAEALQRHLRLGLFRALSDPTRLAVVARLAAAAEPVTVTGVSECCGVHLSGVSRHLALLREAGLVEARKQGREVHYRLDCAALAESLRGLADALEECRRSCCGPGKERR